jgi:hypothetical protein
MSSMTKACCLPQTAELTEEAISIQLYMMMTICDLLRFKIDILLCIIKGAARLK